MKALALATLFLLAGCTVTPTPLKRSVISYDGAIQNGGFLGYLTNGFAVITPTAKERYDSAVECYGAMFLVPLRLGQGVSAYTNGTWLIAPEYNRKAQTMFRWRSDGVPCGQKTLP